MPPTNHFIALPAGALRHVFENALRRLVEPLPFEVAVLQEQAAGERFQRDAFLPEPAPGIPAALLHEVGQQIAITDFVTPVRGGDGLAQEQNLTYARRTGDFAVDRVRRRGLAGGLSEAERAAQRLRG